MGVLVKLASHIWRSEEVLSHLLGPLISDLGSTHLWGPGQVEEGSGHSCPASDPSQLKVESTRFVQLSALSLGTSPWQDPRGQAHTSGGT